MPSPVRPPRLQPVDQSTEQLVLKQTYLGAQINLYADGAPIAQRVVDVLVMDWTIVGNTANFGDVTSDGRPFWTGDFSGSGQDQILFHFPGDSNCWLGAFAGTRLAWSNAGNTANLGNLADGRPFWTGKFSRATQTDVLFYSPSSFTWTLGQFNDGTFRWNEVSDTSNFGNLADGRPFWVGRFSGTGRDDMLFYFPSDGNWWLGTLTQNQLNWTLAGNTADMGVLQDGRPFWTGSFSRPDHTDLVLYSPSDQNCFWGNSTARR